MILSGIDVHRFLLRYTYKHGRDVVRFNELLFPYA